MIRTLVLFVFICGIGDIQLSHARETLAPSESILKAKFLQCLVFIKRFFRKPYIEIDQLLAVIPDEATKGRLRALAQSDPTAFADEFGDEVRLSIFF